MHMRLLLINPMMHCSTDLVNKVTGGEMILQEVFTPTTPSGSNIKMQKHKHTHRVLLQQQTNTHLSEPLLEHGY